ncbi:WD repeat-containing protein CG11141 [Diorhabda sublineata]|uniref:WD repeat-containing protein CG11141 n=1 Tax=Diorhabda sublineata TaxID=1163346 RepID=UPI0024E15637|nr:WD repeat-containing protein CG11141 [Diorhabda sublineata]
MALSQNSIRPTLREWAPLTELLAKLPTKHQNGLLYQEVKIACIDVLPEFIAVGTNVGIVYWFDRSTKDIQRLRCENNISVTVLKIISTVDYMVACGNAVGNISIFQIPKTCPDNLPESLKPKNKQVERYTVTSLHKSPISAIEWSKNGMKLFSGDKNGCVVLTEIDFYMHICKSYDILNEAYEVVQLSYNKQRLLVSTTYRSIICQKVEKWKVSQVGTKDRKVLGSFGGIIYQYSEKPSDICLYCTRPGLRLWLADIEGNVEKTLLFKEILTKERPEVPLINPISIHLKRLKPQKEPAFGILLPFNETLLVTYNNDVLYILDPKEMAVISTVSHLRGILNVATHKDEIFILEEDRSIVRISIKPEIKCGNTFASTKETFLPLSSLKDLTSKLQSKNIITAMPALVEGSFGQDLNIHTDDTLIMNAEEAKESPTASGSSNSHIHRRFEEIGKQEFEDNILYKKSKRKKKRSPMDTSTLSISSNSSEEKESNLTRPTIMNLSTVGVLPDLRSPESIKYDIEYKEKILADVLNLDKIRILDIEDSSGENNVPDNKFLDDKTCKQHLIDQEYSFKQSSSKIVPKSTSYSKEKDSCTISSTKFESQSSSESTVTNLHKTPEPTKKVPHDTTLISNVLDPPACMNIPNTWGVSNIRLRDRTINVISDDSLSDWEIV